MSRKLKLIIAFVLAIGAGYWLFGDHTHIVNQDSSGKNIIAFGDSLTYGTGAGRGEDYPAQLSRLAGVEIINRGLPGDTSGQALARLDKDVLRHDPRIVIVLLGGNDLLQRMPVTETFTNLEQIVKRIQNEAGAMVVLVGVQNPIWGGQYKKGFKKLARDTGALLVPNVLGGVIDNAKYKSDQVHPNGKGYVIVAERIHKKLRPYLH